MATDLMEQIGKLLIKASDPAATKAEQDSYFKMAQKKATANSIELELARKLVQDKTKREEPTQKRISIGEKGKPLNAVFCGLFMDIGRAQGLRFNIAHNSTYVIAFGMPSDIRMAEALYVQLVGQMVEAADAFIKAGTWKGETTLDTTTWNYKPVTSRVARRCFYEAFSLRVGQRLMEAKLEAEAAAADDLVEIAVDSESDVETTGTTVTTTALVLKGKEVEVSDFYHRTSNARGSWKGNRGNTANSSASRSGGRTAANSARLSGQSSLPSPRKSIG